MRQSHLVVVDDNRLVRAMVAIHFRDAGWLVTEASDGAEAVQAIRRERPDVVLMDLRMPVMDGVTATRELRADPEFRALAVFAFTGEPRAITDRSLFTGVLEKPMPPDAILLAVSAVVSTGDLIRVS